MPVTVAIVGQRDVPIDIEAVGNVEAYAAVTVKAQVGGELMKVAFNEGDSVRKGDLLFQIDPRPYQAALDQAAANDLRNAALLGQAEANLARDTAQQKYTQSQAERYAELFKQGIFSKDQTEQISANAEAVSQAVKADRASVESARAQVAAGKAAVETAKVQASYTSIFCSIDGRTGDLKVKRGNIVVPNSMDLMTINQVQPIYATFSVPESHLAEVKKYMAQRKLKVFAVAQDADSIREEGLLTFVDNTVDLTTGTIKLKGTFPNDQRRLWPGQFVRVVLRLTTQPNGIVVPNQAVQTGQDGQFVFVVKTDKTVEMRPVSTGARVEQQIVVSKGLRVGETVVTEGQLRLAPGSKVQLRERGQRGGGQGGRGGQGGEGGQTRPGAGEGDKPQGGPPEGGRPSGRPKT